MGIEQLTADLQKAAGIKNGGISNEASLVIMKAEEHFNRQIDQLKLLSECKTGIKFAADGSELLPDTDLHNGFKLGVKVALQIIGERFPVQLSNDDHGA